MTFFACNEHLRRTLSSEINDVLTVMGPGRVRRAHALPRRSRLKSLNVQREYDRLTDTRSALPIFIAPEIANSQVQGWRGQKMMIGGPGHLRNVSVLDAIKLVCEIYELRWLIESFFKYLKSGFKIEDLRYDNARKTAVHLVAATIAAT